LSLTLLPRLEVLAKLFHEALRQVGRQLEAVVAAGGSREIGANVRGDGREDAERVIAWLFQGCCADRRAEGFSPVPDSARV
jgi:hypothetical protein